MSATFVWFHNHNEKPADSSKFYQELLDWKPADGPPGMTMLSAPGESRRMTYDDKLAARVRKATATLDGITEKKMFAGLSFLLDGKMLCGVVDRDLMVRVGPSGYEAALALPHVRPMNFTGRPLAGFVYVAAPGVRTDAAVASWGERARQFVAPLPAKARKPARSSRT